MKMDLKTFASTIAMPIRSSWQKQKPEVRVLKWFDHRRKWRGLPQKWISKVPMIRHCWFTVGRMPPHNPAFVAAYTYDDTHLDLIKFYWSTVRMWMHSRRATRPRCCVVRIQ